MSIFKISAPVGAGKTHRIAELCALPIYAPRSVLYCAPTIALLTQTAKQLEKNGVTPILIHSKQDDDSVHDVEPVIEQLKAALKTAPLGSKILATHKTLLKMLCCPYFNQQCLSRYTLIVDEETAIVDDHYVRADTIDDFAAPLETTAEGELVIREDYEAKMLALSVGVTDSDALMTPRYKELIDRIVAPLYKVYGEVNPTHISAVSVIDPNKLKVFSEVVLIAGLFEKTLTSMVWEYTFKLDIQPFEHIKPWWHDPHAEGHRMTIRYLLPEGVDASVTKLGANKVAQQIGATIYAYWVNERFIWTANKTVRDHNGRSVANPLKVAIREARDGQLIKPISHGLNDYNDYEKVAALAITQPDNRQVSRVAALAGTNIEDVRSFYRLMSVYQTVGRTAIRKKGTTCPVEVIVLDKTCADQLASIFVGSTVLGQLGDVQCPASKQGTPMTRPPNMTPLQWKAEAKWIRTNLDRGLAGKLKPHQQARFDEYYPFTKQWRDSQSLSNAFDIVPGGFTTLPPLD